MNQLIRILSILLVIQIALAIGLDYAEKTRRNDPGKKILTTDLAIVDQIILEKKDRQVTIRKAGKGWALPEVYNFPASNESVLRLIDKLKSLNGNWPVATTEDAATRFKVGATDFEERIVLKAADKNVATVLIGSSAGYNKVHLRADKSNEVFAVELPEREISTESGDWIDRDAVELASADINVVELPQLRLTRRSQDFELRYGGKVASIDAPTAASILEKIAGLSISDVLGTENKPEYGLDAPVLTCTVELKNGSRLTYKFGKLSGTNFYVLESPSGHFYLKIDHYFVDGLRDINPEELAKKSSELQKLRAAAAKQPIDKTAIPGALKEPVKHP